MRKAYEAARRALAPVTLKDSEVQGTYEPIRTVLKSVLIAI